jgi:hypothetical protein
MSENGEEFVCCVECPQHGRKGDKRGRIEKGKIEHLQWKSWTCPECASSKADIDLTLMDFIAQRIQVHGSEDEDGSKFVFRELLQNADDVESSILVLRFEEEALYAANDGRAFTTTSKVGALSDFEKISKVLGLHKAEDKEAAGHFGSGFQTVYRITNHPEVHSGGRSGKMNPSIKQWTFREEERKSPYWQKKNKGALFVFPWRDYEKAEEEDGGVWKEKDKWPRWGKQDRQELFENLKEYIHQAILCCKNVRTIRLIWHEGAQYEGFQVERDYTLRKNDSDTLENVFKTASVIVGSIERGDWKEEWEDSFQHEGWCFRPNSLRFNYLIGERNVSEGSRVFIGKRKDGLITVTANKGILEKDLKRGDLFIIFPLFDVNDVFQHDGRAYLYSVIPLPGRSKNKFIFSAHFWPTEDRKDVNVEGVDGAYGKWYRIIMLNVAELYEWLFEQLLSQLHESEMPGDLRQRIILNCLPNATLAEWMRPGKENNQEWLQKSQLCFGNLISSITEKPILFSRNKWVAPIDAFWAQDNEEENAFETMGALTFTDVFLKHLHFKNALSEKLQAQKINNAKFQNLFFTFVENNKNESGKLTYGQKLKSGEVLDKAAVENLIKYCITGGHNSLGTLNKAVVPARDCSLNKLDEYPVLTAQLQFLYDFLPERQNMHDDFRSKELIDAHKKHVLESSADDIIALIGQTVANDSNRFENLSEKDHLVLSRILRILVKLGWAPREGLKGLRFIPYRMGEKLTVGTLNVCRGLKGDTEWISHRNYSSHVGENYQIYSIFGKQNLKVPGLTPEVEARIRFLELHSCDDKSYSDIEKALDLEKLMETKDTPVNFVRHFLSPRHESLFVDINLRNFLECDQAEVAEQKKHFLLALKTYFRNKHTEVYLRREEMGEVPCLYDEQGTWHNAREFASFVGPELGILGFKSLHEDFRKWPAETLYNLGVDTSPDFPKIVEKIKKLAVEKEKHREGLSEIVCWLLASKEDIESKCELNDLMSLVWVPTTDGGFRRSKEVLIPSPENKKLLGENYGGFLYSSSLVSTTDEGTSWQQILHRAEILGFEVEPGLSDLLSIINDKRKANTEPPAELFDEIEKRIVADRQKASELIRSEDFGYYVDGNWIDSKQIRLMDEKEVPKEMLKTLVILPADHKHMQYLTADGAEFKLLPDDILQPLLQKKLLPSLNLWDELSKLSTSVDEEYREIYGGAPIYPVGDHFVSPMDMICIEDEKDETFLKEGAIGKEHILGRTLTGKHGEILRRLGARSASKLAKSDILSLIRLYKEASPDESRASLILPLIQKITENDVGVFPKEALWPAEKAGKTVWMDPRLCYYTRDSPLAKHFRNEVSFICLKIDGKIRDSLRQYAIRSGCNSFDNNLKRESGFEAASHEEDKQTSALVKEIGNALRQNFSSYQDCQCFEWLSAAEARSCSQIVVNYSIGENRKQVPTDALVERFDSKWVILLNDKSSVAARKDHLSDRITDECIDQGFPDSERMELKDIVYKLLSNKVQDWSDVVDGYVPQTRIVDQSALTSSMWDQEDEDTPTTDISTIESLWSLSTQEMNEEGYSDTRETLQSWYQSCQICNDRTPFDEDGYTTMETVKRVVCRKGGLFKDHTHGFSTDNSILLCPKHQALWFRRLVRFPQFTGPPEEVVQMIDQSIERYKKRASKNPNETVNIECEVVDSWKAKPGEKIAKTKWVASQLAFRTKHLIGFLQTIRDYFEKNKDSIV